MLKRRRQYFDQRCYFSRKANHITHEVVHVFPHMGMPFVILIFSKDLSIGEVVTRRSISSGLCLGSESIPSYLIPIAHRLRSSYPQVGLCMKLPGWQMSMSLRTATALLMTKCCPRVLTQILEDFPREASGIKNKTR